MTYKRIKTFSSCQMEAIEKTLKADNLAIMSPWGKGKTFYALMRRGFLEKDPANGEHAFRFTQNAIDLYNTQREAEDFLTR